MDLAWELTCEGYSSFFFKWGDAPRLHCAFQCWWMSRDHCCWPSPPHFLGALPWLSFTALALCLQRPWPNPFVRYSSTPEQMAVYQLSLRVSNQLIDQGISVFWYQWSVRGLPTPGISDTCRLHSSVKIIETRARQQNLLFTTTKLFAAVEEIA